MGPRNLDLGILEDPAVQVGEVLKTSEYLVWENTNTQAHTHTHTHTSHYTTIYTRYNIKAGNTFSRFHHV